jgi:hypothetical protein
VLSLQLLPHRLRRREQPMTGAAEGHGDARLEHVAQPLEDDAQRIVAEGKEHRAARLRAAVVTDRQIKSRTSTALPSTGRR